jgi:hypothetical protein
MDSRTGLVLICLLLVLVQDVSAVAQTEVVDPRLVQEAPHRKADNVARHDGGKPGRVSVSTVAWSTFAMAVATGLGAMPFFFMELEAQWAGLCNGLAAGVMLAASFDLVQEGQVYGSGSWVVFGILSGGMFIWLCKKVHYDSCLSSSIDNSDHLYKDFHQVEIIQSHFNVIKLNGTINHHHSNLFIKHL